VGELVKLWLVGAGGMLGRAFRARFDELGLRCEDSGSELDITDAEAVMSWARSGAYSCILNCAAYTAVDAAETDVDRAMAVNGAGAGNLAVAARETGADIVHFSTDYVFDGRASQPYDETAATNPLGVYGKSKLEGERRIEQAMAGAGFQARAFIVRTSWLFGHHGKSFVSTMLELMKQRETLQVVCDQRGRPTYCPDLVEAALALAGITRDSPADAGIYHYANAGSTSWHGLATEILDRAGQLGIDVVARRIDPVSTSEMPRPAPRPAFSVLATNRIERELGAAPPPWQTGVARFLAEVAR
jgi:dTDP-4-dehydrorhamnose reductase